jgi:sporulation protein YlmC with PRC-barrel domain
MPARNQTGAGKTTSVELPDSHLLRVQSLVANKLYDTDGNFVGRLEEIVLDVRTGCVRHVVAALEGFMGFRRKRFAVSWSALTPDANYRRAVIDVAQMRLTAVPIPDGDLWLRRPAAPTLANVAFPRKDRAFGSGD